MNTGVSGDHFFLTAWTAFVNHSQKLPVFRAASRFSEEGNEETRGNQAILEGVDV